VLLSDLVETSAAVGSTSARLEKIATLSEALARMEPEEVDIGVAYLSGELRQRQIGVGWASLRDRPAAAAEPSLTLIEVDAACERIGAATGAGSQAVRRAALGELLGRATELEQEFLVRLLLGDLRQGALAGVMT
jgi:DNA ligase 1